MAISQKGGWLKPHPAVFDSLEDAKMYACKRALREADMDYTDAECLELSWRDC